MECPVCSECHDEITSDVACITSEGDIVCTECVEKKPEAERYAFHQVNIRRLRERWRGMRR
jgi:recombinational DNA repair protein (RecF pathway)